MYPRCVASILSWRAVLVLTALATVLQATSILLSWRVNEVERLGQYSASPHEKELLPHHQNNQLSDFQPETYAAWQGQQSQLHPIQDKGHFNSVRGSSGPYSTRLKDYDFSIHKDNLHLGDKDLPRELSVTLSRLARDSVVDISGQYRVATTFLAPSGAVGHVGRGVTLATQGSVQHLLRVVDMARQWQGPVSVSVFALSHEVQWLVQALLQLRRCHASVAANVSFSVVTPLTVAPPVPRGEGGGGLPLAVLAPLSERRLHSHRGEEWRALLDAWSAAGEEGSNLEGGGHLMELPKTLTSGGTPELTNNNNQKILSNMDNKRRKSPLSDDPFIEGVHYSMKYSRRKLKKYEGNAKYYRRNYFSDLSVNNVDSERNEELSVARNYKKYQGRLGGNLLANYRYVSNSKRAASVIKPSPDSTPCASVPDLSPLTAPDARRASGGRNYDLPGVEYPSNLLRNAAVRAANSPFVLVLDIDMMPSDGLHQHFLDFAYNRKLMRRFVFKSRREGSRDASESLTAATAAPSPPYGLDRVSLTPEDKVAFVLPAYEVMEEVALPKTKQQLLNLIANGQARPFYDELCRKCQHPTNYSVWESLLPAPSASSSGPLAAAYEVPWRDPWEPFYITATDSLPRYDERFRQYGFNRISQVCEAHVSGHRFVVLSPGFVVHRGLKEEGRDRAAQDQEQQRNRLLFRQFKQELKLRYPLSNRRCY